MLLAGRERVVALQKPQHVAHRGGCGKQRDRREGRGRHAGRLQLRQAARLGAGGLRQRRHVRARNFAQRPLDFWNGVEAHRLGHVGARLHEQLAARDRLLDAFDAGGVGARRDIEVRVGAGVERGFELGQHLLDRHDLLARQVAAAVRKHLVADEQAGNPGRLEGTHHLPHVVDAAKAGVGIDIDRNFDRRTDARVVIGVVAHVGLAHVGLRQHRADRGITAGDDRLETFVLDDAGRQRVIGAGHQRQFLARHDGAEFFSGVHDGSH